MKLINGKRYRYTQRGELRTHRNLIGVASDVRSLSAVVQCCTLSNLKEWGDAGIAPQIVAMSHELEPITEEPAAPAALDAFDGLEGDLVQDIIGKLGEYGYRVCVVGQRKAKGSGTTVGYPDLSVRLPAWPRGMACLIETKTKDGTVRAGQETLHTDGWSYVVRSVTEALECLKTFERELMLVGAVELGERLFSSCPKEGKS